MDFEDHAVIHRNLLISVEDLKYPAERGAVVHSCRAEAAFSWWGTQQQQHAQQWSACCSRITDSSKVQQSALSQHAEILWCRTELTINVYLSQEYTVFFFFTTRDKIRLLIWQMHHLILVVCAQIRKRVHGYENAWWVTWHLQMFTETVEGSKCLYLQTCAQTCEHVSRFEKLHLYYRFKKKKKSLIIIW